MVSLFGPCRWTAVVDADRVPPYSCAWFAKMYQDTEDAKVLRSLHLVKCSRKQNIWVVCRYLFDEFNLVLKGDGIYSLGLADGSARVHHCLLCCDAATGTK